MTYLSIDFTQLRLLLFNSRIDDCLYFNDVDVGSYRGRHLVKVVADFSSRSSDNNDT